MENDPEIGKRIEADLNPTEKSTSKSYHHSDDAAHTDTNRNGKLNKDATTNERQSDSPKKPVTTTVPTNIAVPPDGGWGWVVVAASFFCNFVVDGITYSFGIFLSVLVDDLKESKAKVSLIISLMSGCYLIAGMIV